jgi:hypoxanthine-guanine phosphoribosyltransferase
MVFTSVTRYGKGKGMSEKAKALGEKARDLSPRERIALVEDVLDGLDRADPKLD